MLILQPQAHFPIVRQIANHLDVGTYYVKAVVRDADGVTIASVELDSQGGQRYQKKWRVPVDRSGQGAYISIVTSVYTDSGYTTKSENYGDEETTYLVFDRVMPAMRGGGGLSASDVREILVSELDKREAKEDSEEEPEKEVEFPEIPNYAEQFASLQSAVANIQGEINKIPKEKVDFTELKNAAINLAEMIENKEVTPETDLSPLREEVRVLTDMMMDVMREHRADMQEYVENIKQSIVTTISDEMENAEFAQETVVRRKKKEPAPQTAVPFDINKLA